ncbi:MAG: hypothetical protein V4503_02875 [Gemmatimonadota bacterium]
MPLLAQFGWLAALTLPVACISWTVTHEALFDEVHAYCARRSRADASWVNRKFFYLLTCEYCFSHYVTIAVLVLSGFRFLLPGWRGFVLALFALVWTSNHSMSLYNRLRLDLREERTEIALKEELLPSSDDTDARG